MTLKSLTYTSLARLDLTADDLEAIHRTARDVNALEGVTGLLIFNGTHFLQIIEGSPAAIDGLVERLRQDRRHSGLEVRDEREVSERSFPDWSMELVRVSASFFEAKETVSDRLPETISDPVRDRVIRMTEAISGTVSF
ncbi:BLUF domain-containing protein [Sphingomonas hankyongi]|uniref:BLUF domain-containing protein n=1 Tax=Sphingomonas hankyongi TaxID=2908209 RepID=A0ABT0S3M3_9SPHN|nr:BLUF domain-containing protein [Sphingomonas hankyongi]MCL6730426.1 BLUF domain-containing protein [Sphingomonas hankyongi]